MGSDYDQVKAVVNRAIEETKSWHTTGWKMTFGRTGDQICSLEAAKAMPSTYVYREEAVGYWQMVHDAGRECLREGTKAMKALEAKEPGRASDAVYLAKFIEARLGSTRTTWTPVLEAVNKLVAAS